MKTRILLCLLVLGVCDTVIPLPITALVLVYVLVRKPEWFRQWVDAVYRP